MRLLLFFFTFSLIFACSGQKQTLQLNKPLAPEPDGKYDSEFPIQPTAPHLNRFARSIKLISTMTFYKAYQFRFEDYITESDLKKPDIQKLSTTEYIYQRPASGTATLLSQNDRELIFLTCNHIVNHPDTIITYYSKKENSREKSPFVHSMSVKIKETMNIVGIQHASQPVLLAFEEKTDLAIIGVKLSRIPPAPLPVLNVPFGKAAQLEWGTFIYFLSYPLGKLMLSHSLVSQPNRDSAHNFLFNSSLTRGISGGIVLALRDGVPNFEIVGIVSALGAQTQYFLKPDLNRVSWMFDTYQPYTGDIYIDQQVGNNSGVIFAVSAENIVNFLKKNKTRIEEQGFEFPAKFIRVVR
ncbi:S1 family peptidase [Calditrichota bacterium GD2]